MLAYKDVGRPSTHGRQDALPLPSQRSDTKIRTLLLNKEQIQIVNEALQFRKAFIGGTKFLDFLLIAIHHSS